MYIQIKVNQEKSFKSQPWNCSENVLQQFHEQQNEWKFVFSTWAYITLHFYICSNFENNGIFKLPEFSFHVWGRKWFLFQMPLLFIMWDSITWIILGLRTYVFPGNEYATHDRRFYYGDFNCYQFNIF